MIPADAIAEIEKQIRHAEGAIAQHEMLANDAREDTRITADEEIEWHEAKASKARHLAATLRLACAVLREPKP